MRKRSLYQQIHFLTYKANHIGESKRRTKDRTGKIFSIRTLNKYKSIWHNYAEFNAENFGCNRVDQFHSAMTYNYICDLINAGKSAWTIKLHISALQKLNQIAAGEYGTKDFVSDVLPYLQLPDRNLDSRRPNRSGAYTEEQVMAMAEVIEQEYGPEYRWALLCQWMTGARLESVIDGREKGINKSRIKVDHVILLEKGGKMRVVTISPAHTELWEAFRAWAQGRESHCFLALDPLHYSLAVMEAAKHVAGASYGTHGVRKAFAQDRYDSYMAETPEQLSFAEKDKTVRGKLALDLGHGNKKIQGKNRIAVTMAYVSRRV